MLESIAFSIEVLKEAVLRREMRGHYAPLALVYLIGSEVLTLRLEWPLWFSTNVHVGIVPRKNVKISSYTIVHLT